VRHAHRLYFENAEIGEEKNFNSTIVIKEIKVKINTAAITICGWRKDDNDYIEDSS
jgi:hypothetical protein